MEFKYNKAEDEEDIPRSMLGRGPRKKQLNPKILGILVGSVFVIGIVFLFMAMTGGESDVPPINSTDPSAVISRDHEKRLISLDKRLTEIEEMMIIAPEIVKRIDDIGVRELERMEQIKQLQSSIASMEKRIDDMKKSVEKAVAQQPTEQKPAKPAQTVSADKNGNFHEVREGDTLYSIARTNGLSLENLLKINGLTESSVIKPGDRLYMETTR